MHRDIHPWILPVKDPELILGHVAIVGETERNKVVKSIGRITLRGGEKGLSLNISIACQRVVVRQDTPHRHQGIERLPAYIRDEMVPGSVQGIGEREQLPKSLILDRIVSLYGRHAQQHPHICVNDILPSDEIRSV